MRSKDIRNLEGVDEVVLLDFSEEELSARFWKEAAMAVAGDLPFSIKVEVEELKMY